MKTLIHKKLEWAEPLEESMNWYDANQYCESLGKGWRLPTIKELQSIVSYKRANPALKKKFIKRFDNVVSRYYWSSTTGVNNTGYVWYVYLSSGNVNFDNKSNSYYVWPVRDIPKKIKPIEKLYGVIHPNHRIPAQVHHSLERLKEVNDPITGYKIVEYNLNEPNTI